MKKAAFWTMISGGVVALGAPCLGLLLTVLGMTRGFAGLSEAGVSDPKSLADVIGQTLMATASGLLVGGLGLVICIAGLIGWMIQRSATIPPSIPAGGSASLDSRL